MGEQEITKVFYVKCKPYLHKTQSYYPSEWLSLDYIKQPALLRIGCFFRFRQEVNVTRAFAASMFSVVSGELSASHSPWFPRITLLPIIYAGKYSLLEFSG